MFCRANILEKEAAFLIELEKAERYEEEDETDEDTDVIDDSDDDIICLDQEKTCDSPNIVIILDFSLRLIEMN